ncbi:hypothetical protein ACFYWS_10375 [Streptomyces sp. NPDC002795]|uniref:hypothetical protein n=1 Tax=Streptomyces sp. NPDC002795 TaxID=3364665 RepID=UPI003688B16F
MGARRDRPAVRFQPNRPASRRRRAFAFLLGAVVWIGAAWIGLVLLGHTYILWHLAVVTAVSCVVFAIALAWAISVRRREERRVPD